MQPPIIITEDWDITVHPTVNHAESFLEIVDVHDGIYIAYDSQGYLLDLTVGKVNRKHSFLLFNWTTNFEEVIIRDTFPTIDRSIELKIKIYQYLEHKGVPFTELKDSSLLDLIRRMGRYMPWKT